MADGPLAGVKVLEFASIGPGPFCCMLLSDLGANIVRIDRPTGVGGTGPNPVLQRGRPSIGLNLKDPSDVMVAKQAASLADVVVEGNRPGVMERLGLGPDDLMADNPALIYGRMTGFGQTGPNARIAGHDINYLAETGILDETRVPGDVPRAPLNLLGDFGGGALYLAFGIAAALFERSRSGKGQVIDASIVDGSMSLFGMIHGAYESGSLARGFNANILSGAAPFYRCYTCADGRFIAVGAIEPQFYQAFIDAMDVTDLAEHDQRDPAGWPTLTTALEAKFATRPLAEWLDLLEPLDACINGVKTMDEAVHSPASIERDLFVTVDRAPQPAPAPRFSRTPGAIQGPAAQPGMGGLEALKGWGLTLD